MRALVLARQPLCAECAALGIYVPATDVHHIERRAAGGADSFDNLQPLCHGCHSRTTRRGA